MVEIGERPILWHIMKHYASYGFTEFVVALGYKGEDIKRYFLDYLSLERRPDGPPGGRDGRPATTPNATDWTVHLVDTGRRDEHRRTRRDGWRRWLGDEPFMLTYGDGVSDVDLRALLAFHQARRQARDGHGRPAAGAVRRTELRNATAP